MRGRTLLAALTAVLASAAFGDGGMMQKEPVALAEPEQKALIVFQDNREDLILQVKYDGASSDFAWLVPTPSRPSPGDAAPQVFTDLHGLFEPKSAGFGGGRAAGGFGGFGGGVEVLEEARVGVYDLTVLAADDSDALWRWLTQHGYRPAPGVRSVLDSYIYRRWFFTAMRVNPVRADASRRSRSNAGLLHPIRLTFSAQEPVYPLRISSINRGPTDLLLFVAADTPVRARGFRSDSRRTTSAELNRITGSKPRVERDLWLTWLTRRMMPRDMTADLEFQSELPRVGSRR